VTYPVGPLTNIQPDKASPELVELSTISYRSTLKNENDGKAQSYFDSTIFQRDMEVMYG
jgi:hypothetical protein